MKKKTLKVKSWKEHKGPVVVRVDSFDVIECRECQFKHLIPFPDEKELDKEYSIDYYTKIKPDYFERQKEDLKWWNLVYLERLQRLEKLLPKSKRRMLDVGSGPGFFVKFAKKRGWDVVGLEPSLAATAYANKMGAKTVAGFFTQQAVKDLGKFDVIHMQGVMEHMQNPKAAVEDVYKLLNKGGLFCTVVANDFNPIQDVLMNHLKFKPWWVVPSEHINYFSIDSLKKLVERGSLNVANVITTFPIDLFLLMGDNYVGNDRIGRESHGRRKNIEFALAESGNQAFKEKLYKSFAENNIGRDIELITQKK